MKSVIVLQSISGQSRTVSESVWPNSCCLIRSSNRPKPCSGLWTASNHRVTWLEKRHRYWVSDWNTHSLLLFAVLIQISAFFPPSFFKIFDILVNMLHECHNLSCFYSITILYNVLFYSILFYFLLLVYSIQLQCLKVRPWNKGTVFFFSSYFCTVLWNKCYTVNVIAIVSILLTSIHYKVWKWVLWDEGTGVRPREGRVPRQRSAVPLSRQQCHPLPCAWGEGALGGAWL